MASVLNGAEPAGRPPGRGSWTRQAHREQGARRQETHSHPTQGTLVGPYSAEFGSSPKGWGALPGSQCL